MCFLVTADEYQANRGSGNNSESFEAMGNDHQSHQKHVESESCESKLSTKEDYEHESLNFIPNVSINDPTIRNEKKFISFIQNLETAGNYEMETDTGCPVQGTTISTYENIRISCEEKATDGELLCGSVSDRDEKSFKPLSVELRSVELKDGIVETSKEKIYDTTFASRIDNTIDEALVGLSQYGDNNNAISNKQLSSLSRLSPGLQLRRTVNVGKGSEEVSIDQETIQNINSDSLVFTGNTMTYETSNLTETKSDVQEGDGQENIFREWNSSGPNGKNKSYSEQPPYKNKEMFSLNYHSEQNEEPVINWKLNFEISNKLPQISLNPAETLSSAW